MKKSLLPILASAMLLLPSQALAFVNFTLEEDTLSTGNTFTVMVDTETDLLETLDFTIGYTEGIDITSVKDNSGICSTLRSVSQNNKLNIVCTLPEATSMNSVVATVTFDTTSSQYNFTILEDESMDIGDLKLGTVANIENEVLAETDDTTTATTTTTSTDGTTSTEETATSGSSGTPTDTTTIGTTEASTTSTNSSTTTSNITDYLPWILLGGAAILLISIIAIIFSGRKDKTEKTEETPKPEATPETAPEAQEPAPQTISEKAMDNNPPTDIDNISNTLYTPQLNTQAVEENKAAQPESPTMEQPAAAPTLDTPIAPEQPTPMETPVMPNTPPVVEENTAPEMPAPVSEPAPMAEETPTAAPLQQTPTTMPNMSAPVSEPLPTTPVVEETPAMPEVTGPVANLQGDNTPKDENADLAALNDAVPTTNPTPVNNSPMQDNNLSSFNTAEPTPATIQEPTPQTPAMAPQQPVTNTQPTTPVQTEAPADYLSPQAAPTIDTTPVVPATQPAQQDEEVAMPDIPPVM